VPAANYSRIGKEQIAVLEKNGCSSGDWSAVSVAAGFDPHRVEQVMFQGPVELGNFSGAIELGDGIKRPAGIYRARMHNVSVGDNCAISDVNGWISNATIGERVCIENCGTIACVGETSFGNGHVVSVLVEGGGRELSITRDTSAQIAYLTVLYRDRKELQRRLKAMADACAEGLRGKRLRIGTGARITNCAEIINVAVGDYAIVNGAQSLKDGTIVSSKEAPATVGNGVIAEHFILQQGSSVLDGAMVFSSLIGEGTLIGKQFSCENSVFFANCEGFHSEACSIFAGPYTVSHHRSTLLIGGLFSFYNAGSGTNQSNHMYKLGPLHQGVVERGSKTGSFSYLLWPSRVGAFTAVIGKHYAHFDAAEFPFSYINEEEGKSTLVPGMNFFTVGTLRDGEKWPARDRRKNAKKLDLITFKVLSPYTGQKMIAGKARLLELYEKTGKEQQWVTYKGIAIKRLLLKTCSRYYGIALDKYFGEILLARIAQGNAGSLRTLLGFSTAGEQEDGEWVDLCGLLCPKNRVERVIAKITSGAVVSAEQLQTELETVFRSYGDDEWNWFLSQYKKANNRELAVEPREIIIGLLERWRDASLKLLTMVLGDISKEFEGEVRTGFGIDGNQDADFEAVRGTFAGNTYVAHLNSEIDTVKKQFTTAASQITSMKG
jgi:hypothetical protein